MVAGFVHDLSHSSLAPRLQLPGKSVGRTTPTESKAGAKNSGAGAQAARLGVAGDGEMQVVVAAGGAAQNGMRSKKSQA